MAGPEDGTFGDFELRPSPGMSMDQLRKELIRQQHDQGVPAAELERIYSPEEISDALTNYLPVIEEKPTEDTRSTDAP